MRSFLKTLAWALAGFLAATYIQSQITFQYTTVFEGVDHKDCRQIQLHVEPYHTAPIINLFGPPDQGAK